MYPGKSHVYVDDLESFLHAFFFSLPRFSEANFKADTIRDMVDSVFNEFLTSAKIVGRAKASRFILGSYIPWNIKFIGRPRLEARLHQIASMYKELYVPLEATGWGCRCRIV
jgi:hypothetical protein